MKPTDYEELVRRQCVSRPRGKHVENCAECSNPGGVEVGVRDYEIGI